MAINSDDQIYRTKAGYFLVWKLKNDFGIYNSDGVKLATIHGQGERKQRMAELAADAFETAFHR